MPPEVAQENWLDIQSRVDAHPFWYHTVDVAPGVVTPGWFDLRPVLDDLPWPDVTGKRCLDIGTYDGFLAFELERRGAAEVVAVDIDDHVSWDWPPDNRPASSDDPKIIGFNLAPKGDGFRLLAELMSSKVQLRPISIYDLDPAVVGNFDVVVCGSLLLHLRDPLRALEAVRSVCHGWFLSSEQIEAWLTILGKGRPLARLHGSGPACQWWVPNAAGHRRMLYAAGFNVVRASKPFVVRFNRHPKPAASSRLWLDAVARRLLGGTWDMGVLHRALLARPRV